jgi:hypothetical protein
MSKTSRFRPSGLTSVSSAYQHLAGRSNVSVSERHFLGIPYCHDRYNSQRPLKIMHKIILACSLLLIGGCGVRLGRMNNQQKAERLASERGRFQELTNPVDKTKSQIIISNILVDFVGSAARDGDFEGMRALLDQYGTAITTARDVMWESDRDALRNPAGYKDLELALRQHIRRLEEVRRSVTIDEREALDAAVARAMSIRTEMIMKIFPQSNRSERFSD